MTTIQSNEMSALKINDTKSFWMELLDSMFILILCFATLFTAMIIKERIGSTLSYQIDYKTLGAVILSLIVYLIYLFYHSDKQFKIMIQNYYGNLECPDTITIKEAEVL